MGDSGKLFVYFIIASVHVCLNAEMPGCSTKFPESCHDIYQSDNRHPSGEYLIYHNNQAIRVYCSFEGDYGYTFISRKSPGASIDIDILSPIKDFAKLRILKPNGEQREVNVENLPGYQESTTLSFKYNNHPNYQGPTSSNIGLRPYLFLGFLPISLSKNRHTQGYRAADKNFRFKNCDSNPNSYIALYFNPKQGTPGTVGYTNAFMTGWIDNSHLMEYPKYMDDSFYMEFEMHMGGCGGLMTSSAISGTKAALGLPFGIDPCDGVHCKHGGKCINGTCRCDEI